MALNITVTLPKSDGLKFILLIGDQFSKVYETVPIQNQEAKTVAKSFVGGWFSRFEGPTNVHIEMGTNFMSKLFKSLSKELGSDRSTTSTYHSQGTAIIERTK